MKRRTFVLLSAKLAFRIIQIQAEYYIFVTICWVIFSLSPSILLLLIYKNFPTSVFYFLIISTIGMFELPIKNLAKIGAVDRVLSIKYKPFIIGILSALLVYYVEGVYFDIFVLFFGIICAVEFVRAHHRKKLLSDIVIFLVAILVAPITFLISIPIVISFIINRRIIDSLDADERCLLKQYVQAKLS